MKVGKFFDDKMITLQMKKYLKAIYPINRSLWSKILLKVIPWDVAYKSGIIPNLTENTVKYFSAGHNLTPTLQAAIFSHWKQGHRDVGLTSH